MRDYLTSQLNLLIKPLSLFLLVLSLAALVAVYVFSDRVDPSTVALIGVIGAAVGVIGSIAAIYIPASYTHPFTEDQWETVDTPNGKRQQLSITEHRCGRDPRVTVFASNGRQHFQVGVTVGHDEDGTILLQAASACNGKAVIS